MSEKKQPPVLNWIYGYTIARKSDGELSKWHFTEDKDRAEIYLETYKNSVREDYYLTHENPENYHIVHVRIIEPTEFYMEEVYKEQSAKEMIDEIVSTL